MCTVVKVFLIYGSLTAKSTSSHSHFKLFHYFSKRFGNMQLPYHSVFFILTWKGHKAIRGPQQSISVLDTSNTYLWILEIFSLLIRLTSPWSPTHSGACWHWCFTMLLSSNIKTYPRPSVSVPCCKRRHYYSDKPCTIPHSSTSAYFQLHALNLLRQSNVLSCWYTMVNLRLSWPVLNGSYTFF